MNEQEEFEFRARAEQEAAYSPSFDKSAFANGPLKIGKEGFADSLKQTLGETDWGTRNIAGAVTAVSNLWEGAKQLVGQGNEQNIANNRIISDAAPVGSILGNVALTAVPFAMAGKGVAAAAKVGAGIGALNPVEGEQSFGNVLRGKAINTAEGAAFGAAGQKLSNMGGDWLAKKLADKAAKGARNAPIDKTLTDAIDAGLVVPPSSVNPSFMNTMKEGIAGKIATAQTASNRNSELIDSMARRSVGLGEDAPLTSEAMQAVRKQAFNIGYAPIANVGKISTDSEYTAALNAIASKNSGVSRSFPGVVGDMHNPSPYKSVASSEDLVKPFREAAFDAGDALKTTQFLRDKANELFAAGNKQEASAVKDVAKAIENQIERTLQWAGKDGAELLQNFRDARKLMAKAHTVEDAIVEGGGTVNARKLAQRVQAGKPMSDDLAVIGNFANNYPRAAQPAAQVAGPGVSKLNSLAALITGSGGAAVGGPAGAIAGAAAPFVIPPAMRSRLLSASSQRGLIPNYGPNAANRLQSVLLQGAPAGMTSYGLDRYGQ